MSKELEALDRIRRFNNCEIKEPHIEEDLVIIKSALERKEKLEKVWKPIKEYFKEQHDWVLVQFKEKKTGFLPIPKICEYRSRIGLWFTQEDNKVIQCYINESCEAVAFMEIPEYKEMLKNE